MKRDYPRVAPQDRQRRAPLDKWEKDRITAMLDRGMSRRQIGKALGIGYQTVCRFAKEREINRMSPTCAQSDATTVTEKRSSASQRGSAVSSSLRSSTQKGK